MTSTKRALRVGVLLAGNLVEEKLFRGTTPVTFGQSLRCALSIPGDGIPHEHLLFAYDQGRLLLRVTAVMAGRLAQGTAITTDLRVGAGENGVWTLPLGKGVRGKLTIGDATVLFQEVAAPALAPKPVLPASVRGTLADRIDRRVAAIVGVSIIAHLGVAAFAWWTDVEQGSMFQPSFAQTYRHDTIEVTLPDVVEPTPTTQEPGPGAAAPVAPIQTPKPIVQRTNITQQPPKPGMSVDDAQKLASILTGSETSNTGVGGMRDRTPGADLDQQIDAVGNRTVTIGGNPTFREQPGPRLGTDQGPHIDDPTQVANNTPKNEGNPGRIKIKPIKGDTPDTTLTVQMVLDKINGVYMTGLQRCYRKGLLGDQSLAGKIAMAFTVTDRGTLDDADASGVSSEVDACVSDIMAGWRFPVPKDQDGDLTDASFKLSLQLTPN